MVCLLVTENSFSPERLCPSLALKKRLILQAVTKCAGEGGLKLLEEYYGEGKVTPHQPRPWGPCSSRSLKKKDGGDEVKIKQTTGSPHSRNKILVSAV